MHETMNVDNGATEQLRVSHTSIVDFLNSPEGQKNWILQVEEDGSYYEKSLSKTFICGIKERIYPMGERLFGYRLTDGIHGFQYFFMCLDNSYIREDQYLLFWKKGKTPEFKSDDSDLDYLNISFVEYHSDGQVVNKGLLPKRIEAEELFELLSKDGPSFLVENEFIPKENN